MYILACFLHMLKGHDLLRFAMLLPGLFIFFLYLLFFPENALESTRAGLLLWYHSVLPVLFPFMLVSSLLLKFGLMEHVPARLTRPFEKILGVSVHGAFAVLIGFLCGFPMGAKITSDLQAEGKISEREAHYLYGFVNNVSPAFLLSYVSVSQMGLPQYKLLFLMNILGTALLYGYVTSKNLRKGNSVSQPVVLHALDLAGTYEIIDSCIYGAVLNTVKLGVYITVFKIISDAVLAVLPSGNPILLFLGASIEVTGGVHLLAVSQLSVHVKFVLVNALCAFGGLSALAQTVSIAGLKEKTLFYYIKSRVMITLLTIAFSIFSILFLRIFRL